MPSKLEAQFLWHLRTVGLDQGMQREYRFHPTRKWRWDMAWPEPRIAVEIHGVLWGKHGRHQHPKGMANDLEKINQGVILGWRVFGFTGDQVRSGEAIDFLVREVFNEPRQA